MKSLPNVTLISYDNSATPEKTLRALQHCERSFKFGAVVFVCNRSPHGLNGETMFTVPESSSYRAAMTREVSALHAYVKTDFALCVHHDGYVINPDAWRDEWLQYDFIGAPWPLNKHPSHPGKSDYPNARVGNTGFCLKSKAFMQRTYELAHLYDIDSDKINSSGLGGDTFCCQHHREDLEAKGIKFAPVEVAAQFSWESNIEEIPGPRPYAFGFHNFHLEQKQVPRV